MAVAQCAERTFEQRSARARIFGQHPRTRNRRERDRRYQFGIVVAAMTAIGVCPAPVEYVFAVAVGLSIKGHRTDQARCVPCREEARLPPGFPRRAPCPVERRKIL